MNERTCTRHDCNKPHRARGLCGTHYNQAYQPNRHGDSARQSRARRERDKLDPAKVAKERRRQAWKNRVGVATITNTLPRAIDREMGALDSLRYIECGWCGEQFWTMRSDAATCSRCCKGKAKNARRRAVEHGASGSYTWVEVIGIFIAIGRVCAYCHTPQTSADIEPDHVIALSVGGSNSITNIVPCCKPCNSDKRELTMAEWAVDRIRRGLEPRALHEGVTHLTLATLA